MSMVSKKIVSSLIGLLTIALLSGCDSSQSVPPVTPPGPTTPTDPGQTDPLNPGEDSEIDFTYVDEDSALSINTVQDGQVKFVPNLKILRADKEEIPEEVMAQSVGMQALSLASDAAGHWHPIKREGDVIILERDSGSTAPFEYFAGDFLTSQASSVFPNGALLKVVSVEKRSETQYALATQHATIDQVIKYADVEHNTENFDEEALKSEIDHLNGLSTKFVSRSDLKAQGITNLKAIQINIPKQVILCSDTDTTQNIILSGGINMNLRLNTDVSVDFPHWYSVVPNVKLEGVVLVDQDSSLSLTANCPGMKWSIPLATYTFDEISFSVGVITLRAAPTMTLSLNADGKITGEVSFKQVYNGKFGGGVDNFARNGAYGVVDNKLSYTLTNKWSGEARFYPQVKMNLNLYVNPPLVGQAGAQIDTTVNLGAKLSASNSKLCINGFTEGSVKYSANASIVGFNIFNTSATSNLNGYTSPAFCV
ncbi:hypothetical protein K7W42_18465 [Deinococcus sp. HMF7604]|uniref:hypothetical protein n=1 Tax=Deinococcus betulae TaxID=2873312 RepID=UPI001CCB505E|nr:hypothetical protein [Deinococcus betulae]MBZ9752827.1 hypothetical protein [Deinococcus betulae]